MEILILCGGLLLLLFIGVPVAYSLIFSCLAYLLISDKVPLFVISQRLSNSLDSFPMLAIPLFILAAEMMNKSGATDKIFELADVFVGRIRGGLGHVNIASSMLFSGMSGSAVADASGLGAIEIKAMNKAGYDPGFSAAVTAASSTIGPIIPPSIPIVVYGVISGASVSDLFIAGIIPGLIMGVAMMVLVYILSFKKNFPLRQEKYSARHIISIFTKTLPALFLPVIILGGIWGGIFSPTEAAGVAVLYAAILGCIYDPKNFLSIKNIYDIFANSIKSTASIMFIVSAAVLYGWMVSVEQLPVIVRDFLLGISDDPLIILLVINMILLLVGMVMEMMAILAILIPVLLPLVTFLGIDLVYFGVIAILNLMIGFLTPPFGVNLFIMQKVSGVPFSTLVKEVKPFIILLMLTLLLMIFFPNIVMFLPNLI